MNNTTNLNEANSTANMTPAELKAMGYRLTEDKDQHGRLIAERIPNTPTVDVEKGALPVPRYSEAPESGSKSISY